jgi:hypothetical protein
MSSPFQVNIESMPEVYKAIETGKNVYVVVNSTNQSAINTIMEAGKKRKFPFQDMTPPTNKCKKTRYN